MARFTGAQIEQMRSLRSQGFGLAVLEGWYGAPRSIIQYHTRGYVAPHNKRHSGKASSLSPEKIEEMVHLRRQGKTIAEIAPLYGVSRSWVMWVTQAYGPFKRNRRLPPGSPTREARDAMIQSLAREGKTYREITAQLGVSSGTVYRALKQEAVHAE